MASIDLAQMAALQKALENASHDVSSHRSALRSGLESVMLSAEDLNRLDAVQHWVADQLPGVRRRLALARAIEAQVPGFQAYVQLDEAKLPTTTPAEAAELADRAAKLIEEYGSGEDLPDELVDLLAANGTDPYFAYELALKVSPEQVADLVIDASNTRRTLAANSMGTDIDDVETFDEAYESLLDGLGTTYGVATQGTGDHALPSGYAQRWSAAIIDEYPETLGQASALGLVISRGTFSANFLEVVATDVYDYERQVDTRDMWYERSHSFSDGFGAVDPVQGDDEGAPTGYTEYYDPLAGIMAAVGRTPEAAQHLFGTGQVITIEGAGKTAQTNEFLNYVLAERRWPVDDGAGSNAAIAAAITPYEGGDTISTSIAQDARDIFDIQAAEIEERRKNANPFSDIGHMVLDGLGLVPVVGEAFDAVSAVWYLAEGNGVDAALSSASMIPFLGWGAAGTKWTRRALKAEEIAALVARGVDVEKLRALEATFEVVARADGVPIPLLKFDNLEAFNRAANVPHPNAIYEFKGVAYETDSLGRTSSVSSGKLSLGAGGRNSALTTQIGNEGLDTDIGFHLIADSLGGPTNRLNVLPGNGKPYDGLVNLNQGEWARMERKIRDALGRATPANVEIHIQPMYRDGNLSTRPDEFAVEVKIDDELFTPQWRNDAQPRS
ncbi:DNA/RNA non-specific endonuclease [Cellulomonas sp. URHE0023]|uniref:DNA/RNA non-specific endonuclease n=1 Tax=Cellulomonas sp. URHE0023 TaxID=1380354 RepID=UPI00068AE404|nr:DNA/RNA non-specific endonuclease [Cellulomonas sp. URHE0023]